MEGKMNKAILFALAGLSPCRELPEGYFPRVVTFPQEKFQWLGLIDVDVLGFSPTFFRRGAHNRLFTEVYLGISPCRLVLYKKFREAPQCRSFWFRLQMEGASYQPKRLVKKREYQDIHLNIERKKGFFGPKVDIAYIGVTTEGLAEPIEETHRISSIRGFDRTTGGFKKELAEQVIERIFSIYQTEQIPVSLSNLKVLRFNPAKLNEVRIRD